MQAEKITMLNNLEESMYIIHDFIIQSNSLHNYTISRTVQAQLCATTTVRGHSDGVDGAMPG